MALKFTSPARASVPDRLMILPTGKMFFIEFKRSGQKATPAQQREHDRLRQQNVEVYVIDNTASGKWLIDLMLMG